MTRVYGGCVEPDGMELDDETYAIECPNCGCEAVGRTAEAAKCGSINVYHTWSCGHCMEDGDQ